MPRPATALPVPRTPPASSARRPRLPPVPSALQCWAAAAALLALSLLLPALSQSQHYHAFAAARPFLAVADAANVLSNAAFLAVALAGAVALLRLSRRPGGGGAWAHRVAWTLVAGLALTALGSGWYHLHPSDASLLWDRLPMTLSFAAIIALVSLDERDLARPGGPLPALAAYGAASIAIWGVTGNLTPYLAMQGLGLALIAARALHRRAHWFPAGAVLGWYGLAKLLEWGDAEVAALTGDWIAGHPLKHLAAAMAARAILSAYVRAAAHRHPAPEPLA